MLHVINHPAGAREGVLRAMFEARKRVFVDLLGWDIPVIDGRFEVDEFDNARATYLVVTGPQEEHLASARLLPTTGPHLLGDHYAHLCEQSPPRASTIFEVTRFCLERRVDASTRRRARNALIVALTEHARSTGIQAYTAVAEWRWLQQILAFGWRCRPLGLPRTIAGGLLGALRIEIEADTLALLSANGIGLPVAQSSEVRHAA